MALYFPFYNGGGAGTVCVCVYYIFRLHAQRSVIKIGIS